jgi:hypothetical protein
MVGTIIKSIFTHSKQHLFLTSDQEVMVILVDGAQDFTGQPGIKYNTPRFLHKSNLSNAGCFVTSHQPWRVLTTINSSCFFHF